MKSQVLPFPHGDAVKRYSIGERPGRGRYRCCYCADWTINIHDDFEILPDCFGCGPGNRIQYLKIGDEPVHLSQVAK